MESERELCRECGRMVPVERMTKVSVVGPHGLEEVFYICPECAS